MGLNHQAYRLTQTRFCPCFLPFPPFYRKNIVLLHFALCSKLYRYTKATWLRQLFGWCFKFNGKCFCLFLFENCASENVFYHLHHVFDIPFLFSMGLYSGRHWCKWLERLFYIMMYVFPIIFWFNINYLPNIYWVKK